MISLSIFDYPKLNKTDLEVTRYVNHCLAIMIEFQLLMLRDDPDLSLEYFLPRDYISRSPDECRNLFDELYEMITSDVRRDQIKPKYEYLLYHIIGCWEDAFEEEPEILIPVPMDEELREAIEKEPKYILDDGVNTILKCLLDFQSFYDICFFDHDFLPDNLAIIVKSYMQRPDIYLGIYSDVNLDDYLDLMPVDLRELYIEKNLELLDYFQENVDIECSIVAETYRALQRFQKRVVHFESRDEVQISNDLCDVIAGVLYAKHGLSVTREFPMGRALKRQGETDLYIYKEEIDRTLDLAVIENKSIEKFLDNYNQLLGYLNQYFHFGITISINRTYALEDAIKKITENLHDIDDGDFPVKEITMSEDFPYVVKSTHTIPEDKTRQMNLYHMVLHLCDTERKRIAKKARGKEG